MSEITARTLRPTRLPISTIKAAKALASSSVRMKAPCPTLTSSTIPFAPAAIFLLMIELEMRGKLPTVAVTSRNAYSFPSAGARSPD